MAGRIVQAWKSILTPTSCKFARLTLARNEPVQIVTGADNVFEGALVPAALHDSKLPNGMHIKKGKLRGVASNGMLCSGEELGLKEERLSRRRGATAS